MFDVRLMTGHWASYVLHAHPVVRQHAWHVFVNVKRRRRSTAAATAAAVVLLHSSFPFHPTHVHVDSIFSLCPLVPSFWTLGEGMTIEDRLRHTLCDCDWSKWVRQYFFVIYF